MAQTLDYMPQSYRYYKPLWPAAVMVGSIAGLSAGFFGWRGLSPTGAILSALAALACGGVALFLFACDIAWECVIEGGMLAFRSTTQPLRQIPIANIDELIALQGTPDGADDGISCELAIRGGRRFIIERGPLPLLAQPNFGYRKAHRTFKSAVHAVNPDVRFSKRYALDCHACGQRMKPFHYPESQCSHCGATKAGRIGKEFFWEGSRSG